MKKLLPALIAALAAAAPPSAQRPALTAADYARAERFLAPNLAGMVVGGTVTPNWLPDDPSTDSGSPRAASRGERFWYRNQTPNGTEIVVVDAAKPSRTA